MFEKLNHGYNVHFSFFIAMMNMCDFIADS